MGRKPRPKIPCAVPGCGRLIQRRELCLQHYRSHVLPRCRIRGCQRPALRRGICDPHHRNGGKPIRTRPKRSPANGPRLFAWNRLYLRQEVVPLVEREAKRLHLTPTAMLAEIVEAWARGTGLDAPCTAPGCTRAATASGLCRTHQLQRERGAPLTAIRPKQHETRIGSLRMPAEAVARLRREAGRSGGTLAESVRRALDAALRDPARLTRVTASGGPTTRIGALPMPADLAARLTEVAGSIGVSVAEVVRRAIASRRRA